METLLLVIAGGIVAGFVQGLSGFGFALTSMAFWAWTLEPRLAAALAVFGSLVGQILAAITVRPRWNLPRLLPFILGGVSGLPLGLWLLPRLDVPLFKAVLGTLLIVSCSLMLVSGRLPRIRRGGRLADGLAGAIGGVMGGLGGFSGVIPTLWCTLRVTDKDEQRAIIQNFNLSMQTVTFSSYLATGIVQAHMVPLFAVLAPAMLVPVIVGTRLYVRIDALAFRRIVLALLIASGVALLAAALPVLRGR